MFKLAHITDVHLPPLPALHISECSAKRGLGYLSWHRKRKKYHSDEVLKILKADLSVNRVDHIAVTGDQTNIALDDEYAAVRKFLRALGQPSDVSVILGNHDAYRARPEPAFFRFWSEYACDDQKHCRFPYVRKRGKVALIGVNSAVPTPVFMAWGKTGEAQLRQLEFDLEDLGRHGYARIVMIHHPPHKNATAFHRGLLDAARFREVIKKAGAELILSGHLHKSIQSSIEGPKGPVPVRVAGSASSNGKGHMPPAHYHVIEVAENQKEWHISIEHRQFDASRRVFEPVLHESLNLPR